MSRVVYILLSIVIAHVCAAPNSLECPANSELSQCANLCPQTCTKPEKIFCNPINPEETCKQGCECSEGYVKNEDSGECIVLSDCPQPTSTSSEDRTYEDSTSQEPITKEPTPEEPITQEMTTQEPITQEPTTQEPVTQEPVTHEPETQKPITEEPITEQPTTKKSSLCGVNEEIGCKYCEANCDNPNSSRCNPIFCFRKSCTCKNGYLRDGESGNCVPAGNCPNQKCKAGEILAPCAQSCESTCLDPFKPFGCSGLFCFSSSCQCDRDSGYVRSLRTKECVLLSQCL